MKDSQFSQTNCYLNYWYNTGVVDKKIAVLYAKQGLSMGQIAQRLGITDARVRYSLVKQGIPRRSISDAITNLNITKYGKKPFQVPAKLSPELEKLKLAGIMLYWGEGSKSGNVVQFSNSDPEMVRVFLAFLRNVCQIDENRLKAIIHLYPDHDIKKLESFWKRVTLIYSRNFYPSHIHASKPGSYRKKSVYGTISVKYPDTRLLFTILHWIDEYRVRLTDKPE